MTTKLEQKNDRLKPGRKAVVFTGAAVIVMLFIGVLVYLFILSNTAGDYLEKKIEKEFVTKYPSYVLEISGFRYSIWKNRMDCDSFAVASADSGFSVHVGPTWVSGIGWWLLIMKGKYLEKVLAGTVVDAQTIFLKVTHSHYRFSCERLHLSIPDGELAAKAADLRPYLDDEKYFASRKYRLTRFRINVPECLAKGLAAMDLLAGRGCRIRSIRFKKPTLDALVDKYIPVDPGLLRAVMPNEIMNSIDEKVRIERLEIVDGKVRYAERYSRGAVPAIVTFTNIHIRANAIANHGKREDNTIIRGQGNFMHGGVLKLDIIIPLSSPEFSLKYSGSLSPMEINKINFFLEPSESLRIDSGIVVQPITYAIQVTSGYATGVVKAQYKNLKISILSEKTGSSHGLFNRLKSFVMNKFEIRSENVPDNQGTLKVGKVDYEKKQQDTFIEFLWFSLRSGFLDVLIKYK